MCLSTEWMVASGYPTSYYFCHVVMFLLHRNSSWPEGWLCWGAALPPKHWNEARCWPQVAGGKNLYCLLFSVKLDSLSLGRHSFQLLSYPADFLIRWNCVCVYRVLPVILCPNIAADHAGFLTVLWVFLSVSIPLSVKPFQSPPWRAVCPRSGDAVSPLSVWGLWNIHADPHTHTPRDTHRHNHFQTLFTFCHFAYINKRFESTIYKNSRFVIEKL